MGGGHCDTDGRFLRRLHIPEMGDGRDGHVGRDDGVRDAGLYGHNAHANGHARVHGRQPGRDRAEQRLLSDPGQW